ncbi:MAG: 3-deoxy-manno-octulosonate cytidylyltransferase [Rubrimonas sp.]|uniref:3-deoxy-manno-octulosonate cytidylyltransferase n=1 Tax=Rubrimonas sp. TaxID=2036015 RepID=UPI002FDF01C5
MRVALIIPARYASTRFPAKPLAPLTGATGLDKTLIRRSWEAACAVRGVARVLVATDDDRIAEAARSFGAEVAMTDPACANGTERCAEALDALDPAPDLVVNFQGDAPLTPPWFVEALIAAMAADPTCDMATPVLRCDAETLEALRADRRAGRVGGTTAVTATSGDALYFSKEVLPYGASADPAEGPPCLHHVGVYAYRPAALRAYRDWPAGPLERAEGLEQLRFLENGRRVACVEVEARGAGFWELNNPSDRPRIESELRARGLV